MTEINLESLIQNYLDYIYVISHSKSSVDVYKSGISINPHLLRTIFSEKCTKANLKDKYINAFCGRVSQGVLAKNYTDYSSESLRREYDKVEQLLILSFDV